MTAEFPTPVSLATISAIIVTLNLVLAALSKVLLSSSRHHEEAMASWCGTSLGVSVIGTNDSGLLTVLPEASHFAAGCGARTYADGVDTGGIIINTTANIPSIEQTEAEYPVLYLFRRQLVDSGGPGQWRGGLSAGVAMTPYGGGDHETSFSGVGSDLPNAGGLAGGLPGATVRYIRFAGAGDVEDLSGTRRLPADLASIPGTADVRSINMSHSPFPADAIEYHNWQGGGGFGDPLLRSPELVAHDVRAGAVSPQSASEIYGVELMETGEVNEAATDERRRSIVAGRLRNRPARDQLAADDEWTLATTWLHESNPGGSTRYGSILHVDFSADRIACVNCDATLGGAAADFRLGTLMEESPPSAAGPVRGQDYARGNVVLRRFYCPGCGRQIESEVTVVGAPRAAFALAGPGVSPGNKP